MIAAPGFWWRTPPSPLALTLSPLGVLYGAVTAARMARRGHDPGVPVICIGNLTLGGSGKTPTALLVAQLLQERGRRPFILSRGYGGSESGPLLVDPARHTAPQVGDEPLLLARQAPTIIGADRVSSARLAIAEGADCLLMDDGLQNPALAKTLSLAVIEAGGGFGNGLVFPAGPLRASAEAQRRFVSAALLIGEGEAGEAALAQLGSVPAMRGRLEPDKAIAARLSGARVLAMAGLGRPGKFLATLRACGAEIVGTHLVGDHARYGADELAAVAARAASLDALVATTEKDAARFGSSAPAALVDRLAIVPVTLILVAGGEVLEALLGAALSASPAGSGAR